MHPKASISVTKKRAEETEPEDVQLQILIPVPVPVPAPVLLEKSLEKTDDIVERVHYAAITTFIYSILINAATIFVISKYDELYCWKLYPEEHCDPYAADNILYRDYGRSGGGVFLHLLLINMLYGFVSAAISWLLSCCIGQHVLFYMMFCLVSYIGGLVMQFCTAMVPPTLVGMPFLACSTAVYVCAMHKMTRWYFDWLMEKSIQTDDENVDEEMMGAEDKNVEMKVFSQLLIPTLAPAPQSVLHC